MGGHGAEGGPDDPGPCAESTVSLGQVHDQLALVDFWS